MHFSSILPAALCLAASANAVALPKSQGQGYSLEVKKNVTITIYEWLANIAAVNKFVDSVGFTTDPKLISVMAATAYPAAKNEGASNTIISSEVTLDATGEAASKALPAKFNIIGPAINDTIFHPENVKKNVATVNAQRCAPPKGAGAISEEVEVQQAAAKAIGIVVPPPSTPLACA